MDLYKFYFDLTLKANVIFYGIAGAVASFVLSHIGKESFRGLLYALWIPALLGLSLTIVSFYGFGKFRPFREHLLEITSKISPDIHPDVKPLQRTLFLTASVALVTTAALFCSPYAIPCLIK